jgi:serine/threonine protein kinase
VSQLQSQPGPDPVRGAQIGPYEVLSRLALGGMAELLLARRVGIEGFQKLVVLKRFLPQYASNPDFVDMFLHEARLAAALEHPNIVQVFDIGKSGDDYYFAMAYLHGKDALAILRELGRTRQQLPVEHAIAIGLGIAAGLHHAHEQIGFDGQPLGIVHRDVSPANAIVTFDGTVKLVDFGIAKAAAQVNHTRAGVRKGKAAYMSPKQCRGDALDRRTDIWSLGVMLYELVTMTRLFRADNDLATMHRIVSMDAPSPRVVRPELPAEIEAIVLRCLRRDREQRYPTAAALQQDLDACAHTLGLRPGAAGLSTFLRGLYGTPPLPWAPRADSPRVEAVTHSVDIETGDGVDGRDGDRDSTRDLGNTPPPAVHTAIASSTPSASSSAADLVTSPRRGDLRAAIALGLALGIGGAAWLLWPRGDAASTATAPATASGSATAPAATPPTAAAPEPAPDLEAWLGVVNRDDAIANPIVERHRLLAELRRTDMAARIDEALQVRLDLAQARAAARPCETFATALERAAKDPAAFADATARADPPDPTRDPAAGRAPDRPCEDLPSRLASLRDAVTPTATPSAGEGKPRPRRRPTTDPAAAPTPTPSAAPSSTAGKLDDELRPFRK